MGLMTVCNMRQRRTRIGGSGLPALIGYLSASFHEDQESVGRAHSEPSARRQPRRLRTRRRLGAWGKVDCLDIRCRMVGWVRTRLESGGPLADRRVIHGLIALRRGIAHSWWLKTARLSDRHRARSARTDSPRSRSPLPRSGPPSSTAYRGLWLRRCLRRYPLAYLCAWAPVNP